MQALLTAQKKVVGIETAVIVMIGATRATFKRRLAITVRD
jgi:hypothetical protein